MGQECRSSGLEYLAKAAMMNRLILLVFSFFTVHASLAQRSQPNIIIILTDDMGYGDLSCLGGKYKTPGIDQLATQGRVFYNYYSAAPICSPSRVGLMTG